VVETEVRLQLNLLELLLPERRQNKEEILDSKLSKVRVFHWALTSVLQALAFFLSQYSNLKLKSKKLRDLVTQSQLLSSKKNRLQKHNKNQQTCLALKKTLNPKKKRKLKTKRVITNLLTKILNTKCE